MTPGLCMGRCTQQKAFLLFSLSGLNGGRSPLRPMCFPGDSETLVDRGDKQITVTFIGEKYNIGESGTITL